MGTFDFMHGGEGGGLPQGRPPSLEAPPPPQIAGQLADAVAHGIKADATLRLGAGVCRRPPGLALQAIFLHQIFHAIDDGPITTTSSELPTGL